MFYYSLIPLLSIFSLLLFCNTFTAWKVSVSLRIQSKYGKLMTRKNSVFRHFSRIASSSQVWPYSVDKISFRWNTFQVILKSNEVNKCKLLCMFSASKSHRNNLTKQRWLKYYLQVSLVSIVDYCVTKQSDWSIQIHSRGTRLLGKIENIINS